MTLCLLPQPRSPWCRQPPQERLLQTQPPFPSLFVHSGPRSCCVSITTVRCQAWLLSCSQHSSPRAGAPCCLGLGPGPGEDCTSQQVEEGGRATRPILGSCGPPWEASPPSSLRWPLRWPLSPSWSNRDQSPDLSVKRLWDGGQCSGQLPHVGAHSCQNCGEPPRFFPHRPAYPAEVGHGQGH